MTKRVYILRSVEKLATSITQRERFQLGVQKNER